MTRTPQWLPLGLLVLLVALTFWLNRLVQPGESKKDGSERHDPDLIVENFSARKLGLDGAVRYTLIARKMMHYPDDDSSELEAVSFQGTDPGQPSISATSQRGQILAGGDKVIMEGQVVIEAAAGKTTPAWRLTTPRLVLLPDDNIAQSDAGVQIQSSEGNASAASFVLNTETRVLTMQRVKAIYQRPRP